MLLLFCPLYLGIFLLIIEKHVQTTNISIQTCCYIATNTTSCNSGRPCKLYSFNGITNVVGLTKHLLIGFKTNSMSGSTSDIVIKRSLI